MFEIADQLIADRRRRPLPDGEHDILDTMLQATDPQTGERLSDENVRYQLVTFLIAGHETTSGLLTFTTYELLKKPDVLAKAQTHVDEVLGDRAPRFEDWLYWHSHNSVLFVLRHARRSLLPLFFLKRTLRLGLFAVEHGSVALIAVGLQGFARGIAAYRATR